jgi:Mrp family chromosome partitioning ATPase
VHQVDGVLVINRMGISRRDHAVQLMKRFNSLGAHILGVVVNSYRAPDDSAYGYYHYTRAKTNGSRRGLRARPRIARIR